MERRNKIMTEQEKIEAFKSIDFGDLDANADPNLEKYFMDNDFWHNIIEKPIYYVTGKKGTGKSAIYQFLYQSANEKGTMFSNRDFGDFPFQSLIQLSDDEFSQPNQYQSIWQHVIIDILIDLIIKNQSADRNDYFKELKSYYDICIGDTINLHKDSITKVKKTNLALLLSSGGISPNLQQENEFAQQIGNGNGNISAINTRLLDLLINYFITRDDETPYIIQFDRLDDTYNQYTNMDSYFHVIISLLKVVYKINNSFRLKHINDVKIVIYLRSDIMNEIGKRDSESARWDDFTYKINWAIINQNDWENSALLQMVNKRIDASLQNGVTFSDIFDTATINLRNIDYNGRPSLNRQDIFKYMIDKTFHRPRDVVQFLKYIQKEVCDSYELRKINFRTIKNAEKQFTSWLLNSELANEINPIIKDINELYELLRKLGGRPFSYTKYLENYNLIIKNNTFSDSEFARYLYEVGIFMNVNRKRNGDLEFKSIIRNTGSFNPNMQIMIHQGVWKGLQV